MVSRTMTTCKCSSSAGAAVVAGKENACGISNNTTMGVVTLVVDRNTERAMKLALRAAASPTSTSTHIAPSAAATARAAKKMLVVSRSAVPQASTTVIDPDVLTVADTLKQRRLAHTHSALILDNVASPTLAGFELLFERTVVITAYPTYRSNVGMIIVPHTSNQFVWDSLFGAFLSTKNSSTSRMELLSFTSAIGENDALRCKANLGEEQVTWSLSITSLRSHSLVKASPVPQRSQMSRITVSVPMYLSPLVV